MRRTVDHPFVMSLARIDATEDETLPKRSEISQKRCGPSPSSAIALMYFFSVGVNRSKRTLKSFLLIQTEQRQSCQ